MFPHHQRKPEDDVFHQTLIPPGFLYKLSCLTFVSDSILVTQSDMFLWQQLSAGKCVIMFLTPTVFFN